MGFIEVLNGFTNTHPWHLQAILDEECLSYIARNEETKEALIIDPKLEVWEGYLKIHRELSGYRFVAVIDTHTHADHISVAARLATYIKAPLIMHEKSFSSKVCLRVCCNTHLSTQAGVLQFFLTPGHTPDGLCILWGPYFFSGDTVLYDDVGRDDLPGGNPEEHYESLINLKKSIPLESILLPGHDNKGGRAALWKDQLKTNSCLSQERETFISECGAFNGTTPKKLKESLFENLK